MSSEKTLSNISTVIQRSFQNLSFGTLCKSIATTGVILFLFYLFLFDHPYSQSTNRFTLFQLKWPVLSPNNTTSPNMVSTPTNLSNILFVVVGSVNTWKSRKSYIESWWRPNVTRGYLFLDGDPTRGGGLQSWPSSCPPFLVNEAIRFRINRKHAMPIRIGRTLREAVRQGDKDIRWYVIGDDDTVFFLDNLVKVLAKYDHSKNFYIGMNSECVASDADFSFDMAFGGAGIALSFRLAEALSKKLEECDQRYPNAYSSDNLLQKCLADLGVALTRERGFHQIDLRYDISGLLSAHPQSPVLSLHHMDVIDPIFPAMTNRSACINRLMKAAKVDQSRLLQQTICYQRKSNWSFSTSWGYSVHIYESIYPRSFLQKPLETFGPWMRHYKPPFYRFNTRILTKNPCEAPHEFFLESVEKTRGKQVVTTYARKSPRHLPPCSSSGNHSADHITKIHVFSSATTFKEDGVIECCDADETSNINVTHIKLRSCMKDEIIA